MKGIVTGSAVYYIVAVVRNYGIVSILTVNFIIAFCAIDIVVFIGALEMRFGFKLFKR